MLRKIAVSDYAKMVGKSRTSVIRMIEKGLLSQGYINKDGKRVKAIIVEDEQMLSFNTSDKTFDTSVKTCNTHVTPPVKRENSLDSPELEEQENMDVVNRDFSKESIPKYNSFDIQLLTPLLDQIKDSQQHFITYQQQITELQKQVISYAELAGQAKLLTDSENKTREEYFRIMQENVTLKTEIKQLHEKLKSHQEITFVSWLKKL